MKTILIILILGVLILLFAFSRKDNCRAACGFDSIDHKDPNYGLCFKECRHKEEK